MFLVKKINPKIDKMMNRLKEKVPVKFLKIVVLLIVLFLVVDCIATCLAQDAFITRLVKQNNIEVENQESIDYKYEKIYENETISNFIYKLWNDEKMIKTFPNIKIEDKNKNIIYLDNLLPDIQTYYLKIFEIK